MTIILGNLRTSHVPRWAADMLWPEVDNINQEFVAIPPVEQSAPPQPVHPRGLNWTDDAYASLINQADNLRMTAWKAIHAKQPPPPLTEAEVQRLARLDRATWWLACRGAKQ